jgi:hypothetical protein
MAKKTTSDSKKTPSAGKPSSLVDTRVIEAFFKKTGKSIIALTVKDILDEQITYKLA